ncbi:DUF3000 family protein [Gleimia hominis]|uniref:DUF3000 family protein n=1 Tax=Gleimia hominis TaxID=595468 RepID=A0ABU3IBH3_9ACTO|nr:DUF3000 family protein [Gleimia hominis]MDT3767725.1 DUF3000 family protein [Gleimia hominis]
MDKSARNTGEVPPDFLSALLSIRDAVCPPQIQLEEVPAPRGIAPFCAALHASVPQEVSEVPLASGSFVVLHDPDTQPGWGGKTRLVVHARSQFDVDLAQDPLLSEVLWSWTHEALDVCGANVRRMNGTVTRELADAFGGLQLRSSRAHVDLRGSWTPAAIDLAPHVNAWLTLLGHMSATTDPADPTDFTTAAQPPQTINTLNIPRPVPHV